MGPSFSLDMSALHEHYNALVKRDALQEVESTKAVDAIMQPIVYHGTRSENESMANSNQMDDNKPINLINQLEETDNVNEDQIDDQLFPVQVDEIIEIDQQVI